MCASNRNDKGSGKEFGVEVDRPLGYASRRWVRLVSVILNSEEDLRTLDAWARETGVSVGALRAACAVAGISAKDSLDFARLLRVILRTASDSCSPFEVLNVVDARTMRRLLRAGSIDLTEDGKWPTLRHYLDHQTFVTDRRLVEAAAEMCDMVDQKTRTAENSTVCTPIKE